MGAKKKVTKLVGSDESFDDIDPMNFIILGIMFVVILVVYYTQYNDEGGKDSSNKSKTKFLIPKKGGALQQMAKDSDGNIKLKLVKRIRISADTNIYRFGFADEKQVLGLPIGKHVVFSATVKTKDEPKGELIERKYTPISMVTQKGYVDFLVKVYSPLPPRFPEGGIMSQYVDRLKIDDTLMMQGPKGKLTYEGYGNFVIQGTKITGKTKLGFVAGGTGITPCYQVIQAALKNGDGTSLSLIFGNRTVSDILLKDELSSFADTYKDKFKLYFTVDIEPEKKLNWQYGVGFVDSNMMAKNLPAPSKDTLILYCGPPPFEKMMKKNLQELGFEDDMYFKF